MEHLVILFIIAVGLYFVLRGLFRKPPRRATPPNLEATYSPDLDNPKTKESPLEDVTSKLAASLKAYSEVAREALQPKASAELEAAHEKVDRARVLVLEGGIASALGTSLPEHVKYWPAWSQRDDFREWVGFGATEITAKKSEEISGSRTISVCTIDFAFKDASYRIILRDCGMSYVPDSLEKLGKIELFVEGRRVAKFDLVEDLSTEYSAWSFSEVRALEVGPWMKDVLDMAAQISASRRRRTDDIVDTRVRETAREISLDSGVGEL